MTDLTFYDAAYPPNPAPHADGFCFYLPGGDAYHPWTRAEIDAQPARYRLPVFVRSDPPGPGAAADVATAVAGLRESGAPKGTVVAWDAETSVDAAYIRAVYGDLKASGYLLIVYGTQSDVMGNDVPDGLYFGAEWTDVPHLHNGDAVTQWVSFSGYDEDLAKSSLPFWDTKAEVKPPADWTFGAPQGLTAHPGHTSVRLEWSGPSGSPEKPAAYRVFIYAGATCDVASLVATYPRETANEHFQGGGLKRGRTYMTHVVAEGPGGTRVAPDVFASAVFTTG